MLRYVAGAFGCVVAGLGLAFAVPARPLYVPPDTHRALILVNLRDTAWAGTESADRNLFFHSDGKLSYTRGQQSFGTWTQDGNNVYFEFNKRYREFRGVIQGGVILGESWNVTGKRWPTRLQRVETLPLGALP